MPDCMGRIKNSLRSVVELAGFPTEIRENTFQESPNLYHCTKRAGSYRSLTDLLYPKIHLTKLKIFMESVYYVK